MNPWKDENWINLPDFMISQEGSYECHFETAKAREAIEAILNIAENYPPGAERAIEALFNIARSSIGALDKAKEVNPEAFKTFAGYNTEWPHMLIKGTGWKKSKGIIPEDVWHVLNEMGLGASLHNLVKTKNDCIGLVVKSWFNVLDSTQKYPEYWSDRYSEWLQDPEPCPTDDYLYTSGYKVPELKNDKKVLRKWAKAIYELIVLDQMWSMFSKDHRSITDSDIKEAGVEMIEIPEGTSELFDKNPVAYSLLRPISDTFMENKFTEARTNWEESLRIAKSSLGKSPTDEEVRSKTIEVFKRMFDGETPEEMGDHPTDKEFKAKAIEYIMGRLKGMVS